MRAHWRVLLHQQPRCRPGVANRTVSNAVTRFNKKAYITKALGPLLLLNVQDSKAEADVTMSQYNLARVSILTDLVVNLNDIHGVTPSDILVLTFYKAHVSVPKKAIEDLDESRPGSGIKTIKSILLAAFQDWSISLDGASR